MDPNRTLRDDKHHEIKKKNTLDGISSRLNIGDLKKKVNFQTKWWTLSYPKCSIERNENLKKWAGQHRTIGQFQVN